MFSDESKETLSNTERQIQVSGVYEKFDMEFERKCSATYTITQIFLKLTPVYLVLQTKYIATSIQHKFIRFDLSYRWESLEIFWSYSNGVNLLFIRKNILSKPDA